MLSHKACAPTSKLVGGGETAAVPYELAHGNQSFLANTGLTPFDFLPHLISFATAGFIPGSSQRGANWQLQTTHIAAYAIEVCHD